jgi:hypothetical protein
MTSRQQQALPHKLCAASRPHYDPRKACENRAEVLYCSDVLPRQEKPGGAAA